MKTMLPAAIVVFSIGASSAHAGDGDAFPTTTLFTSIPGEQSSQVPSAPRQAAIAISNGAMARGYVTTSRRGTWLFPAVPDSGGH